MIKESKIKNPKYKFPKLLPIGTGELVGLKNTIIEYADEEIINKKVVKNDRNGICAGSLNLGNMASTK